MPTNKKNLSPFLHKQFWRASAFIAVATLQPLFSLEPLESNESDLQIADAPIKIDDLSHEQIEKQESTPSLADAESKTDDLSIESQKSDPSLANAESKIADLPIEHSAPQDLSLADVELKANNSPIEYAPPPTTNELQLADANPNMDDYPLADDSPTYTPPTQSNLQMSDDPSRTSSQAMERIAFNSRFQIGGNYTYVDLKPDHNPSFGGSLGGIQALYEYNPMNYLYEGLRFAWQQGRTHGSSGKRSLIYFDVQERLGYTMAPDKGNMCATLFSGFGYRYIGQKLTPKEGRSLKFGYNEFYFPVGLLTDYDIISWLSFGINFTWMPQVYPTVSITPLKGAHWSLSSTFANFFLEVPFTFALTKSKNLLLSFTPFYERWQDGHSTAKLSSGTALGLPGNTYNFYGASLNLGYRF